MAGATVGRVATCEDGAVVGRPVVVVVLLAVVCTAKAVVEDDADGAAVDAPVCDGAEVLLHPLMSNSSEPAKAVKRIQDIGFMGKSPFCYILKE